MGQQRGSQVALNGCKGCKAQGKKALHCCLRSKFVKLNSQQQPGAKTTLWIVRGQGQKRAERGREGSSHTSIKPTSLNFS